MTSPGYYDIGETTYFAAQSDQRFGYCLYVPRHFTLENSDQYRLAVIIHGTTRTAQLYRSLFADFAESGNCIILAPLFPAGIIEKGELSNYKFIKFHDIRYDLLLLDIVAEVAEKYQLADSRFLIHGFSGGGQFVHRFLYLHPRHLLGASIGAPGMVTLLDDSIEWHCGTGGMEQIFGSRLNLAEIRKVPVQMVVGAEDTETWEIIIEPGSRFWMEGVNDAGRTRIERLRSLQRSFEATGIEVRFDLVPGIAHQGYDILQPVKAFFTEVLAGLPCETRHTGERHHD